MNINFTVRCDTCGENTNIRFGMSNRDIQPVRFACQDCSSPIDIILEKERGQFIGATQVKGDSIFDAGTNFVDLHLDFPVSFEPYVMGNTPFLRAVARVGDKEMSLHRSRLNHLNDYIKYAHDFKVVLKLYAKEKFKPFKLNVERVFRIPVKSERLKDINAALYKVIALMMMAYEYPLQSWSASDLAQDAMMEISSTNRLGLKAFLQEICKNNFLKNLQLDVLEIYPRMLDAELVMRPALFLDFDTEYAENRVAMRVSAQSFEEFKDLYKDISEIISRETVLVAGMNNLLKRGDHNAFAEKLATNGRNLAPENLNAFADVDFGRKLGFIDDSWHDILDDAANNKLRNAIAHYKAEYDDLTQVITYFPMREGMEQHASERIYFLEFTRLLLISYREMHRLGHLIKGLFYYLFIVM